MFVLFVQNIFHKNKCQVSNFFFIKMLVRIKIKIGYYSLDRQCEVSNTFFTRTWISKFKIFGSRLLVYLNNKPLKLI